MLKAGQCIGMGDKIVGLLVEVQSVHGDKMKCYVVNGNWEFDYSLSTGRMDYTVYGERNTQYTNVLFTDPYPRGLGGYNEIIYHMNEHLTSSWFTRLQFKTSAFAHAVVCFTKEAPTRFMNAIRGLRSGWTAPLDTKKTARFHDDDYFDDDIPF